ncbi:hypothetical protein JW905_16715 [bacterium]|nr:hypothetical protein [candidate division CSSED10-310 bacterium]
MIRRLKSGGLFRRPGMGVLSVYAASLLIFHVLGYQPAAVRIAWRYYQLLDPRVLFLWPVRALLLSHSQPPVLNGVLGLILHLSNLLSTTPERLLMVVFMTAGLFAALLVYQLVFCSTGSRNWALAAVIILLADPGFHFFMHLYFYPFILLVLLLALLKASAIALSVRSTGSLALVAACLVSVCLTRTLFHPLWALLYFMLLCAGVRALGRSASVPSWRRMAVLTGCLVLILCLWPMKNLLLFDRFIMTSWSGFNLSRSTPERSEVLEAYLVDGTVDEITRSALERFARRHGDTALEVIASPLKSNGTRNWNHYLFLTTDRELARRALGWLITNPGAWLRSGVVNYFRWTRATYTHPYYGGIRGPSTRLHAGYAGMHRRLLFADIRPLISACRRLCGGIVVPLEFEADDPNRITLFGVLVFPLLMLISFVTTLRRLRRTGGVIDYLALLAWLTIGWVLTVPCLTDGMEGNRMRFCCTPYILWLSLTMLHRLVTSFKTPPVGFRKNREILKG